MRRGKVAWRGAVHWCEVLSENRLKLAGGCELDAGEVTWLPPVTPGATTFALGLNYADHSAELGFAPPAAPLVFLKGPRTFVGHGGVSPLPAGVLQMHPECELVAVMSRPARRICAAEALDHVAGYTIANDYALRDYLENFYRPNLRVKNRDETTPLGPWIADAADVGDPQKLAVSTLVNGKSVQQGSTSDMLRPVAELIEYLSEFMTLMPGDLILTGTPHGVHFVEPGDEVACTIDKIGSLVTRVEAE